MALIASPNLTVDRTVRLARLVPGAVLRPGRAVVTAGSKGLNVGRVLAALGHRGVLLGFVPEDDRDHAYHLFGAEPVDLVGVPVAGGLRVATIYLEDDGRVTVLNEPGPDVDATDWDRYEAAALDALQSGAHRTLACSGSLPPGAPVDAYGRLTALARRAGVRSIVDAARDVLVAALAFEPDLVTPNLAEAEVALGHADAEAVDELGDDVPERAATAVRELCRLGASLAVVTAGAAGAAYGDLDRVRWIPAVPVTAVNPIGAGDSFVGGLVVGMESGQDDATAILHGMAAAGASCEQVLAGGVDPATVRRLLDRYTTQVVGGGVPV